MTLAAPTNCWPYNLQSFVDALAESEQFQDLVAKPTAALAKTKIFGNRLTHTQDGNVWTVDDLAELRAYGQVFTPAGGGYGKHLSPANCYLPHGAVVIALARLVPDAELVAKSDTRNGLTDEHDREWQNICGSIADEVLVWLRDNGGPWPVTGFDVTSESETPADEEQTQGVWQGTEFTFTYREGG